MAGVEVLSLAGFAFLAGIATFFAPCAYPLLPGYISYYLGQGIEADGGRPGDPADDPTPAAVRSSIDRLVGAERSPRIRRGLGAVFVGVTVSAGFFVVYGVLAGIVVTVGSRALSEISVLELVVGALLIVLGGLTALGRTPKLPTVRLPARRRSTAGFFGFGVVYAAAAAGCTAPLFIGVAAQAVAAGPGTGVLVIGAYAVGMAVLMIGITVAAAFGRDALISRLSGRSELIRRATGVLLIVAGIVQIYFYLVRFGGLQSLGLA